MSKAFQAIALMAAALVAGSQNAVEVPTPPRPSMPTLPKRTRARVRKDNHVKRRSEPRKAKSPAWATPHQAARGVDESDKDYRARINIQKRLRKLQADVVWNSNVTRVKPVRTRTAARAAIKSAKVVAGRKASADNRARVAAEKARKASS